MCDLHEIAECQRQADAVADACPSYDAWQAKQRLARYQDSRTHDIASNPRAEIGRMVAGINAIKRLRSLWQQSTRFPLEMRQ